DDGLPWAVSSARTLSAGGCAEVVVVIGAAAPAVRALLAGEPVTIIEADDWNEGMGASLRAGLRAIAASDAPAALVHLVDLPDVGPEVIRRVLAHAAPGILARASYDRDPEHPVPVGHPVLIGRDHWAPILAEATGDTGARAYLARHDVLRIECSDLSTGIDIDSAPDTGGDTASSILPKLRP
ncbi:MAG: NTP transferase domain-containing protein, partial [Microbacteriaceae bacterium]